MLNDEEIAAADVFFELKHDVLYVSDEKLYGFDEFWSLPIEQDGWLMGDCEDWAMLARELLKQRGIESRLVVAYDDIIGYHLVTVTEHGWILDNMLNHIATVQQLFSYHFIMQSGFLGDAVWHFIK